MDYMLQNYMLKPLWFKLHAVYILAHWLRYVYPITYVCSVLALLDDIPNKLSQSMIANS